MLLCSLQVSGETLHPWELGGDRTVETKLQVQTSSNDGNTLCRSGVGHWVYSELVVDRRAHHTSVQVRDVSMAGS